MRYPIGMIPIATLLPKEDRRLLRGHIWAYRNEFAEIPKIADGDEVDVVAQNGRFIGRGYFQAEGGIAVRLVVRTRKDLDEPFFAQRISACRAHREQWFPGSDVYRWIFGESDRFPGLVADRYGELVSIQAQSEFWNQRAEMIAKIFLAEPGVRSVVYVDKARSDTKIFGETTSSVICEIDTLKFNVNLGSSQKTGLFLDQRENWQLLERYVSGGSVLDGHCYVGAWGLHAAKYGAKKVVGVDTSESAISQARDHAELNGFSDTCEFQVNDIQEALKEKESYDVVILDPPALAKNRRYLNKATGLYRALNRDAIQAIRPGGYLITSSCSQSMGLEDLISVVKRAAGSAQRQARLLEIRGASPDHPVHLSMPETEYLHCLVLQIM
ncbi:MAG: rRNA large subunit methyltransferase I [Candidatus Hydrogenedentota bacterium]|nr:MAG: rRNA large subunit methyltransferase I [Candidatus Hydrogenedentota bacterium]